MLRGIHLRYLKLTCDIVSSFWLPYGGSPEGRLNQIIYLTVSKPFLKKSIARRFACSGGACCKTTGGIPACRFGDGRVDRPFWAHIHPAC
jgi:hypothetical protein